VNALPTPEPPAAFPEDAALHATNGRLITRVINLTFSKTDLQLMQQHRCDAA